MKRHRCSWSLRLMVAKDSKVGGGGGGLMEDMERRGRRDGMSEKEIRK